MHPKDLISGNIRFMRIFERIPSKEGDKYGWVQTAILVFSVAISSEPSEKNHGNVVVD